MMKHILSVAIIALISAAAQAEDTVTVPFSDLDSNHDGALSAAEAGALPEIAAQWTALDLNGDGQLNHAEFSAYQLPAPAAGSK